MVAGQGAWALVRFVTARHYNKEGAKFYAATLPSKPHSLGQLYRAVRQWACVNAYHPQKALYD